MEKKKLHCSKTNICNLNIYNVALMIEKKNNLICVLKDCKKFFIVSFYGETCELCSHPAFQNNKSIII